MMLIMRTTTMMQNGHNPDRACQGENSSGCFMFRALELGIAADALILLWKRR